MDREPQRFSRTEARWHAQMTLERRLTMVVGQLALASVARARPSLGAQAAAESLVELADRSGARRFDGRLYAWLGARRSGDNPEASRYSTRI